MSNNDKKVTEKNCNYLSSIAIFFYMILLSASVAGQKLISIFGLTISAGSLIFPMTYMLIACITEVYGLKAARRIIITGALCNVFVALYLLVVIVIPPVSFWTNQSTFYTTTSMTVSILLTSTIAYVISEYANARIISKLKIFLQGKWLLGRAITSTSAAAIIDSTLMLPVIFYNSPQKILSIYLSLIVIKICYEVFLLPFFWLLTTLLKKLEGVDILHEDSYGLFSSVTHLSNHRKHY